ncbi:MAG: glutamate--tRNA ligase [Deltaproteobacteria bacterium]|nr:glutamate--tRNA ligase [Deltaproteobacteria bacterium]
MLKIRTRFPPSPTGFLHIGGARTALFNWLFSRQQGGVFVLRIEDTDQVRSTDEATRAILEGLEWLGLDWDEGPFFQSQRTEIYRQFISDLLDQGKAYYCHCSPELLETKREKARAEGRKPKYDGTCREKNLGPGPQAVVRLKNPLTGSTGFNDLIRGPILFSNEEMDDLVLARSDGSPTYHLAVVVDDITMEITHIIRGDDHLNNTPRQIQIYKALGRPLPLFGHVPMILGPDKTRLSKRHGATSVLAYKEMGFLPQALVNYLVRLGWAHGDEEIFSRREMIEKFSLAQVGKSAGVFNQEKLLWLNSHYIKESDDRELAGLLAPFLQGKGFRDLDLDYVARCAATLKIRSKTLVEMADAADFYLKEEVDYQAEAVKKFFSPQAVPWMEAVVESLDYLGDWNEPALEIAIGRLIDRTGATMKQIAPPLRLALTGKTASPGLFEVMAALGQERTLKRLNRALIFIKGL